MLTFIEKIIICFIKIYQRLFSAIFPPVCRFYPSCSNYMIQAISEYSLFKGIKLGTKRILKCHPFYAGGLDYVGEEKQ